MRVVCVQSIRLHASGHPHYLFGPQNVRGGCVSEYLLQQFGGKLLGQVCHRGLVVMIVNVSRNVQYGGCVKRFEVGLNPGRSAVDVGREDPRGTGLSFCPTVVTHLNVLHHQLILPHIPPLRTLNSLICPNRRLFLHVQSLFRMFLALIEGLHVTL